MNQIYNEDAEIGLFKLYEQIDLTVCSPPYDDLRTYNNSSVWNFEKFSKICSELYYATKAGGVCVWVVADQVKNGSESGTSLRQALEFINVGWSLWDTMIYQKRNFSHPEKRRYHSVFEYMYVFSKGRPKTFNPIKDRKNLTAGAVGNFGVNTFTERDGSKSVRAKKITQEYGMRHNVWLGNTRGQEDCCVKLKQPAMMPRWIARDHIISWSNEGDLVCDPFLGSGTVAEEAKKLKRNYIGFEVDKQYFDLAVENLNKI